LLSEQTNFRDHRTNKNPGNRDESLGFSEIKTEDLTKYFKPVSEDQKPTSDTPETTKTPEIEMKTQKNEETKGGKRIRPECRAEAMRLGSCFGSGFCFSVSRRRRASRIEGAFSKSNTLGSI
jgi:hypothetical protein